MSDSLTIAVSIIAMIIALASVALTAWWTRQARRSSEQARQYSEQATRYREQVTRDSELAAAARRETARLRAKRTAR